MKNRNILSLKDRLEKCEKDYRVRRENERKKEEFLEKLRETPLWNDESVRLVYYDFDPFILNIELYNVEIETVITSFCSCLHMAYGIDWTMKPGSLNIRLTSRCKDISIVFEIFEEDKKTCQLRKRIIKTRSDSELEYFRHQFVYEMNCEGETEK